MPDPTTYADLEPLVAKCLRGDERAWRALVERTQSLVYSVPRRLGLDADDCADVFQATYVALYRSLDRIESAVTIPKWLAVAASRESHRILRARSARSAASLSDDRSLEDVLADENRDVEAQVTDALEADHVRRAVARLQQKCRELLSALYYEAESSYQEIATRLGIAIGSIGPMRARCLDRLRSILAKEKFFEGLYQAEPPSAPIRER